MDKANTLDVGSTTLAGELPCGYIDLEGKLHNKFIVKELTGVEEDLIAGTGPVLQRLNKVISNCTVSIGSIEDREHIVEAVNSLTALDRMMMLLSIRRVSLGKFFDMRVTCPMENCRNVFYSSIDLSKLEVTPMPDPMVRSMEDKLASGKSVKWHVLSAEDEMWLMDIGRKHKNDRLTLAILARVDWIDGVKLERSSPQGFKAAVNRLKVLTVRERQELRFLFRKKEGDIDTDIEFTCPECGHEWTGELNPGDPGFFFPQET